MTPEGKVMQEIPGALLMINVNLIETSLGPDHLRNHLRANGQEFPENVLNIVDTRT